MLCIECTSPVKSLYTVYSNKHIQLTDCSNCHNVVDRYVEIDNVILFIDLLLLKPGAYRHLVYNSLEKTLSKHTRWQTSTGSRMDIMRSHFQNIRNWFLKFDRLNRVWVLLIAFEVYLTWVTEERKYSLYYDRNRNALGDNVIISNLIMNEVFEWDPLHQYLYFAVFCIIDISLFHSLTRYCIINWFHWGKDVKYAKDVLSYAILLSYGAKIFPILMLIWPYDTVFSMNIIKWVANLYIIESLRVVTRLSYTSILKVFCFVSLVRWISVKPIMLIFIAKGDLHQIIAYFRSEFQFALQKSMITENYFLL